MYGCRAYILFILAVIELIPQKVKQSHLVFTRCKTSAEGGSVKPPEPWTVDGNCQGFMHDLCFLKLYSPINALSTIPWIASECCTTTDGSAVGFYGWFILMDPTQIPPFLLPSSSLAPPCSPTPRCRSHPFHTPMRQMDWHSTSHHLAFQGC